MTAAERSELAEFRQEMNDRFDRVDTKLGEQDVRLRVVESFVSNQQGRAEARKEFSASRIAWLGVAAALLVVVVGLPAAVYSILHIIAVGGL